MLPWLCSGLHGYMWDSLLCLLSVWLMGQVGFSHAFLHSQSLITTSKPSHSIITICITITICSCTVTVFSVLSFLFPHLNPVFFIPAHSVSFPRCSGPHMFEDSSQICILHSLVSIYMLFIPRSKPINANQDLGNAVYDNLLPSFPRRFLPSIW